MAAVMNVADFLLARIAEDEAVAQAAKPGPWHWDDESGPMLVTAAPRPQVPSGSYEETAWRAYYDAWGARTVAEGTAADEYGAKIEIHAADATHIARHDPARVLAECEAKRRIVELYQSEADVTARIPASGPKTPQEARSGALGVACLFLALPYADHPDYRSEWRP